MNREGEGRASLESTHRGVLYAQRVDGEGVVGEHPALSQRDTRAVYTNRQSKLCANSKTVNYGNK